MCIAGCDGAVCCLICCSCPVAECVHFVVQELKVDGVSNYLHMVNNTHIIGLGSAAGPNGGLGGGLQLSLFDVTDVTKPVLSASKVFGTSSSSSLATTDHKVLSTVPAACWPVR